MGTSLSDSGNAFALLGTTSTPPDYSVDPFLIPDRPYARGGQHFSDGPTWVEQLARSMALAGSARPAFRSNGLASNYAVGGARAREVGSGVNLGAQVGRFLQDMAGSAPSDALYAVEIGANDVRDSLAVFAAGGDGGPILADALAAIGQQILQLYAATLALTN